RCCSSRRRKVTDCCASSSIGSTGFSDAPRKAMSVFRERSFARALWRWRCWWPSALRAASWLTKCRRAFFPMRTRATSISIFRFPPPSIPGVGTSGGFTFVLEDRSGKDLDFLTTNLNTFMAAARKRPEIAGLATTFLPSVPQQFVNVDRDKVIKQGVPINDVYKTIQAFMGGLFINYFTRFGRQWEAYIEAEGDARHKAET